MADLHFLRTCFVCYTEAVSKWLDVISGASIIGFECLCTDMIEELISRGQQVDAVHFTYEVGLEDKFPPVPLLKAFLKDAKKAATSILEDPNNSGRAAVFYLVIWLSRHFFFSNLLLHMPSRDTIWL